MGRIRYLWSEFCRGIIDPFSFSYKCLCGKVKMTLQLHVTSKKMENELDMSSRPIINDHKGIFMRKVGRRGHE